MSIRTDVHVIVTTRTIFFRKKFNRQSIQLFWLITLPECTSVASGSSMISLYSICMLYV